MLISREGFLELFGEEFEELLSFLLGVVCWRLEADLDFLVFLGVELLLIASVAKAMFMAAPSEDIIVALTTKDDLFPQKKVKKSHRFRSGFVFFGLFCLVLRRTTPLNRKFTT